MEKPIDEEGLKKYIEEHLVFEIDQLLYAAKYLRENKNGDKAYEVHYLAFAVHARNLSSFLMDEDKFKGDALAKHFVKNANEWASVRQKTPCLEQLVKIENVYGSETIKLKERLHRQVAHLTYSREFSNEKTRMPAEKILGDICGCFEAFIKNADEKKVNITSLKKVLNELGDFIASQKVSSGSILDKSCTPTTNVATFGDKFEVD